MTRTIDNGHIENTFITKAFPKLNKRPRRNFHSARSSPIAINHSRNIIILSPLPPTRRPPVPGPINSLHLTSLSIPQNLHRNSLPPPDTKRYSRGTRAVFACGRCSFEFKATSERAKEGGGGKRSVVLVLFRRGL